MTDLLKIAGGRVLDPTNDVDAVRDLWIRDGKIVAEPERGERPTRVVDATGDVVMPGGVDMHSHIAGSKVNIGRGLSPEARRTGEFVSGPRTLGGADARWSLGNVPTTVATGLRYSGLGYTTAFDAAVAPLLSPLAHRDLAETPNLDTGCFLVIGNDRRYLELLAAGDRTAAREYLAWILNAARGYAFKLVNPGNVEAWKRGRPHGFTDLDAPLPGIKTSPRAILRETAALIDELALPHPAHVHCNDLGLPGNWRTTLETIRARRRDAHLCHIQYHSYLGGDGDETTFGSATEKLLAAIEERPNLSFDVGQALLGPATIMTGDSPAAQFLAKLTGGRRVNHDLECAGGCGVMPIEYKNTSVVHAWQFVIGLEWFLLARDPWRLALTTDHPNGAVFWRYPFLIRLLMDAAYRRETLAKLPRVVRERTAIRGVEREYTLREICILTRAAPAKLLGLTDRGHLGVVRERTSRFTARRRISRRCSKSPSRCFRTAARWSREANSAPRRRANSYESRDRSTRAACRGIANGSRGICRSTSIASRLRGREKRKLFVSA
ncbi:MAG: formylmethanofuran dehydrogenase subunit A [Pirellulales bacterium]